MCLFIPKAHQTIAHFLAYCTYGRPPAYHLPLSAYHESYPSLLSDGALEQEQEVLSIAEFFVKTEETNRCLAPKLHRRKLSFETNAKSFANPLFLIIKLNLGCRSRAT